MHSDVINKPEERLEVNINPLKWWWCGRRLLRPPTCSDASIKRSSSMDTQDVNISATAESLMNCQQDLILFHDVSFNYSWAISTESQLCSTYVDRRGENDFILAVFISRMFFFLNWTEMKQQGKRRGDFNLWLYLRLKHVHKKLNVFSIKR